MKTLTDFKKALQLGTVWNCLHVASNNSLGDREIVFKNTVKVGFKTDRGSISYLHLPKASEIEFHDGEAHIFHPACKLNDWPRRHALTYKQVA